MSTITSPYHFTTLDRMTPLEFSRRNAGLTQREVEHVLGFSKGTLTKFERGQQWPWPAARRKLAQYFEIPEDILFPDD